MALFARKKKKKAVLMVACCVYGIIPKQLFCGRFAATNFEHPCFGIASQSHMKCLFFGSRYIYYMASICTVDQPLDMSINSNHIDPSHMAGFVAYKSPVGDATSHYIHPGIIRLLYTNKQKQKQKHYTPIQES